MSSVQTLILTIIGGSGIESPNGPKQLLDGELVAKVMATKDTQLFGILYDRYSNKVYNKCFSFVKNRDEAKDLTQEIFIKVFLKLQSYNSDKASFSTWLYTITYNFCANYVTRDKKKMGKTKTLKNQDYRLADDQEVDIAELNQLDPEKLDKALTMISPEEKAILLLKYQDDTSILELQQSLALSASAVKMRLNRAKLKVIRLYATL